MLQRSLAALLTGCLAPKDQRGPLPMQRDQRQFLNLWEVARKLALINKPADSSKRDCYVDEDRNTFQKILEHIRRHNQQSYKTIALSNVDVVFRNDLAATPQTSSELKESE